MTTAGHWHRCTCTTPQLTALIAGNTTRVHPAFTGHPLSRIYCARCAGRPADPAGRR